MNRLTAGFAPTDITQGTSTGLSIHSRLLPYVEESTLNNLVDVTKAYDAPENDMARMTAGIHVSVSLDSGIPVSCR